MSCRPLILILIVACQFTSGVHATTLPNMVLFIGDDISWNDFGCYGNSSARTTNIDRLAANGLRFSSAYLTASSCSPSRCSIITGRYPHNLGPAVELHGQMPWHLPVFPALLREAGYYTVLSGKDHMPQSQPPAGELTQQPFDKKDGGRKPGNSGGHANWVRHVRERPSDRPFFFWFASFDAHRAWDADQEWDVARFGPAHEPQNVIVPPFLADTPATRRDLASYYNEVTRYDYFVGQVVKELHKQGVLENTLILVMADNGRPFPRAKTRVHDSGMKTALVAHWPRGISPAGAVCDSLVSAIDLAPTILDLAGITVPETMQGVSLKPLFVDPSVSVCQYAFSEHNWHDYEAYGRSVRSKDMLFVVNKRPQLPWQGPADSVRSPAHQELLKLRETAGLALAQAEVFMAPRPEEELYLIENDPHQLTNLVDDSAYSEELDLFRKIFQRWQEETGDTVPEQLSVDSFDRETGERIHDRERSFRRTPPGAERDAEHVNEPGPR